MSWDGYFFEGLGVKFKQYFLYVRWWFSKFLNSILLWSLIVDFLRVSVKLFSTVQKILPVTIFRGSESAISKLKVLTEIRLWSYTIISETAYRYIYADFFFKKNIHLMSRSLYHTFIIFWKHMCTLCTVLYMQHRLWAFIFLILNKQWGYYGNTVKWCIFFKASLLS